MASTMIHILMTPNSLPLAQLSLLYTSAPWTSSQETQAHEIQNWACCHCPKMLSSSYIFVVINKLNFSPLTNSSQKCKSLHKSLGFLIPHIKIGIKFFLSYLIHVSYCPLSIPITVCCSNPTISYNSPSRLTSLPPASRSSSPFFSLQSEGAS